MRVQKRSNDELGVLADTFNEMVKRICLREKERDAAEAEMIEARDHLEEKVDERTRDLRRMVNAMSGREVRMAELKKELKDLKGTP